MCIVTGNKPTFACINVLMYYIFAFLSASIRPRIYIHVFCMFICECMCVGVYLLEYNQLGI